MNATVRKDLYEQVTQSIVAMMEEGMARYIQWTQTGHGLPCNHQTGIPYQGVNVLLLWAEAMRRGYGTSRWQSTIRLQAWQAFLIYSIAASIVRQAEGRCRVETVDNVGNRLADCPLRSRAVGNPFIHGRARGNA